MRRRVRRQGHDVTAWVPLRKSVTLLFRYREISAQSNVRYLDALSQVQDPTPAVRDLDALTTNASTKDGRTVRAFNPLSRNERMFFEVLLAGEHALHGFTNREVRGKLARTSYPLAPNQDRQPSLGHPVVPPSPCARTHRQNPALAPLAGLPPWPQNHGHCHQTQGSRLPQSLRSRRLICRNIFAKHKEDTRERFTRFSVGPNQLFWGGWILVPPHPGFFKPIHG